MNDLRKLARIILVGMGIYVLVKHGIGFAAMLPFLFFSGSLMRGSTFVQLVSYVLGIACVGLVIYALVWKADFWSAKITHADKPDQAEIWWLPFAFRLAAVCAGIIILSWSISTITSTIARYAQIMSLSSSIMSLSSSRASIPWLMLVAWIIQLALAIYLICGAPHFVRWHVKKTIEHCKRLEEPNSISDQEAGV